MRIYIKNPDRGITPAQLMAHIQSHGSVIGLCLTPKPATHYLFDVKDDELRRYPIRMNTKTALDHYTVFQHNDFENPTPPTNDRAPKISEHHYFFTPDEVENIIKAEKKCPYLEGSPLSPAQQDLLYSGVVVPRLGMSFYYFLNEYILPLPNPEKALQGAIACKEVTFNDDDEQGESALQSLRYHFLAPNRIVFFDEQLYPDASHKPTVGAILDFYTHCMQAALRKLEHETVAIADLRTYSDRSRAAELGDLQYHFTEDEIHEPQGLSGVNDVIFRFITLLLSPQNQTPEAVSALINNPGHTVFFEHRIALYRATTDLITALETDSMTKIRSYLSAYDNIDAVIPHEGWKLYFLPHLITAQRALLTMLSATDVIINDQRITEEQRAAILGKLEEKTDSSLVAEALIMLYIAKIPISDGILDRIIAHHKPLDFASAVIKLTKKNITLTQLILDALKNETFLQIIEYDERKIDVGFSSIIYSPGRGGGYSSHAGADPIKFILTQRIVDLLDTLVAEGRNLSPLIVVALTVLQLDEIAITPSILDAIFSGEHPDMCARALISLFRMNITLTPFVLNKLVENKNITGIANDLAGLRNKMYIIRQITPDTANVGYIIVDKFEPIEREGVAFAFCVLNQYHRWKATGSAKFFSCCYSDSGSSEIIQALDDFVHGNKNALEAVKFITPGSRLKSILAEFGLLKEDGKLDISKLQSPDDVAISINIGPPNR